MKLSVKHTKQFGKLAQLVRKNQGLDQASTAMLSGNGTTFLSDFENGKSTVEFERVMKVLDALGIMITVDLPLEEGSLTDNQRKQLDEVIGDIDR